MGELKISKEFHVLDYAGYLILSDKNKYSSTDLLDCDKVGVETAYANANLFAEAGTIANQTGLTPKQLLEQRDELLDVLKDVYLNITCSSESTMSKSGCIRNIETILKLK